MRYRQDGRGNKNFIKLPSKQNEYKYKTYRNNLYHLVRKANKNFYKKKFNDPKSNLEQTRQTLDEILSRLKYKTALPRDFLNNGKVISDHLEFANQFNEYFINVGPSLANFMNHLRGTFTIFNVSE